jgi:hypothetical protein
VQPELESFGREVRAEFLDQEIVEVGVLAFAEEFPHVLVRKGCEGGYFELEKVVLAGIEVDGVDTPAVF